MPEKVKQIADLILKYLNKKLSEEEQNELIDWANQSAGNRATFEMLTNPEQLRAAVGEYAEDKDTVWKKICQAIPELNETSGRATPVAPVRRIPWRRYAVAAVAGIIMVMGVWWIMDRKRSSSVPALTEVSPVQQDSILPTGKAVLTLGDGSTITLDTASDGLLAKQGSTRITKLHNGQLLYSVKNNFSAPESVKTGTGATLSNTLRTLNGGTSKLILPDGTKVWLNAASSIQYPVDFGDRVRQVSITGEVYFEIAPFRSAFSSSNIPFIVTVREMQVQATGTRFNVNAYGDDQTIRTTLLEGVVRVIHDKIPDPQEMKPGQQFTLYPGKGPDDELVADLQTVNTNQVMAWMNGKFQFSGTDLASIMKQLERWYNVKAIYKSSVSNEKFTAIISRNRPLPEILQSLEKAGDGVRFSLINNTIAVHK